MRIDNFVILMSSTGSYAGAVFGMPVAGLLTEYAGWPVVFYVFGKYSQTRPFSHLL